MLETENKELLQDWIDNGYAVADKGDGAWWWTKLGLTQISGINRMFLSRLLYGNYEVPSYALGSLYNDGFSHEGFVIEEI